jgi:import receptor subunit TOM70
MSSDDSFADRISSFVSGNKRGIVIGAAAAAVAIGGVAYYVASSRAATGAGDEESLREGKKKDKKKKKHRKSAKDKDGPVLEERKPKATDESDDGLHTTLSQCVARSLTRFFFRVPDQPLTEEQIQALGTEVSPARRRPELLPIPC